VKAAGDPVLSVVPAYTAYPPELSYAPVAKTDEPAVIVRERGTARLLYFPGDLERTAWRSGHTDLSRLLRNSVAWLTRDHQPVTVTGEGVVECSPGRPRPALRCTSSTIRTPTCTAAGSDSFSGGCWKRISISRRVHERRDC